MAYHCTSVVLACFKIRWDIYSRTCEKKASQGKVKKVIFPYRSLLVRGLFDLLNYCSFLKLVFSHRMTSFSELVRWTDWQHMTALNLLQTNTFSEMTFSMGLTAISCYFIFKNQYMYY